MIWIYANLFGHSQSSQTLSNVEQNLNRVYMSFATPTEKHTKISFVVVVWAYIDIQLFLYTLHSSLIFFSCFLPFEFLHSTSFGDQRALSSISKRDFQLSSIESAEAWNVSEYLLIFFFFPFLISLHWPLSPTFVIVCEKYILIS